MAVSVDNRGARSRSALAALLTALILVPAGYLFFNVWQADNETRDDTKLEQQGVEYLTTLAPLISSLAESESSALQGVSTAPASVAGAVTQVNTVDQRLGEVLQTRQRWSGLKDKIGRLPAVAGDPQAVVLQAHVEVTDLALALYNTVRNNSTLVRDPDNDLSHLQQAVAFDLPNTVVQVNRMGDLAGMRARIRGSSTQRAAQEAALGPQFGGALQSANTAVGSLTDNLQAAVDDTNSPTLSGNLLNCLDSFRRGVESLSRGANPGGAPVLATMTTAQTQLQTSLNGLSRVALREMGSLLDERLDALNTQRMEALLAAGFLVLLVIAALIVRLTGSHNDSLPPSYGEVNPTRRERSGALR